MKKKGIQEVKKQHRGRGKCSNDGDKKSPVKKLKLIGKSNNKESLDTYLVKWILECAKIKVFFKKMRPSN